jgi:hypothetical protein
MDGWMMDGWMDDCMDMYGLQLNFKGIHTYRGNTSILGKSSLLFSF